MNRKLSKKTPSDKHKKKNRRAETHQHADHNIPVLTTAQGTAIADDQNSLRIAVKESTLLEDFHFRVKIFHFDHEIITERVGKWL